jgi:hypothetical protein
MVVSSLIGALHVINLNSTIKSCVNSKAVIESDNTLKEIVRTNK